MKFTYIVCTLFCVTQIQAADDTTQHGIRFGLQQSNVSVGVPASRAVSQLIAHKNNHLDHQLTLQKQQLQLEEQQKQLKQEQQHLEHLIQQAIREEHNFSYQEKGNIVPSIGAILTLKNQAKRHIAQKTDLLEQQQALTELIKQAEEQIPADIYMYLTAHKNAPGAIKKWIDLRDRMLALTEQYTKNKVDISESIQRVSSQDILERLQTDACALSATTAWLNLKQEKAALDEPLATLDNKLHDINDATVANATSLQAAFNYFITNDIATLTQYIINEKRNEALSKNPCEQQAFALTDQELRNAIFDFKIKQLGNNLSQEEYALLRSIIPTIPLTVNDAQNAATTVHTLTTVQDLITFSELLLTNKALHKKRIAALDVDNQCNIFEISLTDDEITQATQPALLYAQLQNITSQEQFAAIIAKHPKIVSATAAKQSSEPKHIHTIHNTLQSTMEEYLNTLPSRLNSPEDTIKLGKGLSLMFAHMQKRIAALEDTECPLNIKLTREEAESATAGWKCHQIIQAITNTKKKELSAQRPHVELYRQEDISSAKPAPKNDEPDETSVSFLDLDAVDAPESTNNAAQTPQSQNSWLSLGGWLS